MRSSSSRKKFLGLCLAATVIAITAGAACAQNLSPTLPGTEDGRGWAAFGKMDFLLKMATVLLVSLGLAALIAYHPIVRKKAATVEDLEQPKILLLYAMVGALVAIIVSVRGEMAFVVFGIGGLLRFRSNVGDAHDTPKVILVTVAGLCCGLELYVVAFLGTAFGWILISMLERTSTLKLELRGIEGANFSEAAASYAGALRSAGCMILGESKNPSKGRVTYVLKPPAGQTPETLDKLLAPLQGTTDWTVA